MNTPFHISWTKNRKNKPANRPSRPSKNIGVQELKLDADQMLHFEGDLRGMKIHGVFGTVWLTQQNDPEDYLLKAGDDFVVTKPGMVVVQGVHSAMIRTLPAAG